MNLLLIIISILLLILTAIIGHNYFYDEMKNFDEDFMNESYTKTNKDDGR